MKKFANKIIAPALAAALIAGTVPAAFAADEAAKGFADVKTGTWYAPYVEYVAGKSLMDGVSATSFAPNGSCTRAMAAVVLYRFANPTEAPEKASFEDLDPAQKWYQKGIAWAEKEGIVKGVDDTHFAPNGTITRQDFLTMLYRYNGSVKVEQDFLKESPDASQIASYARDAMNWAISEHIISGDEHKNLSPKSNLTRAALAKIITVANDGIIRIPAVPATCEEDGTKEYWKDSEGNIFLDEAAQKPSKKNSVPKDEHKGHKYANGVCTICDERLAEEGDIVIFHTNDVHCHIDEPNMSYAKTAALKDQAELAVGKNGGVLLVDAGDTIQGTPNGGLDKGYAIMDLVRMTGYDAATFGNHEFDYGMARALEVAELAGAPTGEGHPGTPVAYLSSNFFHEKDGVTGESVVDAYKIFDVGGKKIAILGITTPETYTKSTPSYFQNEKGEYIYGIAGGKDGAKLYAAVQDGIDDAKAAGADMVVAIGHIGVDESSRPWTAEDIINHTSGMDAFIDGHSHTVRTTTYTNNKGEEVNYAQTGCYFQNLGMLTIKPDGTIETEMIDAVQNVDPEVDAATEAWLEKVNEKLGQTVANSEVTFYMNNPTTGKRMVRSEETNLGDFVTDALRWYFTDVDPVPVQNADGTTTAKPVDFAIMNGGGIRAEMVPGKLTTRDFNTVHTFNNLATVIELSGQKVLDALEWAARNATGAPDANGEPVENGGFLQCSGLYYEIHTYIPDGCTKDEKGNWTGHVGEYRVKNVKINGEPLDLSKTYTMAGQGYTLKKGGDGFSMFKGCPYPKDEVRLDYQVLADYAAAFPEKDGVPTIGAKNSPLGADYSNLNGEGRIVLVTKAP